MRRGRGGGSMLGWPCRGAGVGGKGAYRVAGGGLEIVGAGSTR